MSIDLKISPKNIILDWGNYEDWENGAAQEPTEYTLSGSGSAVARESTEVRQGTYSCKITSGSIDCQLLRDVEGLLDVYAGRKFTYGAWVKCSTASKARIQLNDGVGTSSSSYHTGGGDWEFLSVTRDIDASATRLRIINAVEATSIVAYFDGTILCEGDLLFTDLSNVTFEIDKLGHQYTKSITDFDITRRKGKKITDDKILSRTLNFSGSLIGTSVNDARTNLDTIKRAFFEGEKDFYFTDDRVLRGYLDSFKVEPERTINFYEFSGRFRVNDIPTEIYFNKVRNSQSISSSPTSFTVTNNGNTQAYPVFNFIAGGSDITTITLENMTNGQLFSYTGTVSAGNTLVIDTNDQSVVNNAVDDIGNFSNGDFIKLEPGDNILKYTGTVSLTLKTDYFERYL